MDNKFVFLGLAIGSFILGVGLTKLIEGIISADLPPIGIILTAFGFILTAFSLYYNKKK